MMLLELQEGVTYEKDMLKHEHTSCRNGTQRKLRTSENFIPET